MAEWLKVLAWKACILLKVSRVRIPFSPPNNFYDIRKKNKDFAVRQGRLMCERLKELIPRHQFQIPIQAAIGGKVIARETISGYRKDVISRIHGGGARDRKKKLLEKQKKGKARMRQFGSVDIPQEAFIEVLKINKNNN